MKNLNVKFENCYGIKSLNYNFKLNDSCRTYAVYAPNGVMKTSFAKTVTDYVDGKNKSRDAVFSREPYNRDMLDDAGVDYERENVFVINSYVDTKFASDKISTLLVRNELREKYEDSLKNLVASKKPIINDLATNTKSSDCEKEVLRTFSDLGNNFFDIIKNLIGDLGENEELYPVHDFRYNDVFENSSVANFINKNKANIKLYHDKYYEILEKSDGFFSKDGSFGTLQASSISKSVEDDSFFKAGHRFLIKDQGKPLDSSASFITMIDKAKSKVLSDPELKKQFDKIDSALAPKTLAPLRKLVGADKNVLLELLQYEDFQKRYWKGHLVTMISSLESLMNQYAKDKIIIDKIIEQANDESDRWKETIGIFESRFIDLPFEVRVKDKKDAVLGIKQPELEYVFVDRDTDEKQPQETNFLTESVLSNGEKRAFYILNVIFEIESRRHSNQETLFVIDDIADSFDYKNKYAIVEYLHDISQSDIFSSIILTHNFDFYRTVTLRLKIEHENRLFAQKEVDHITLVEESVACPMDPFKKWKLSLGEVQVLALIPFVRNLIEYGRYDSEKFLKLTSLLHVKSELKHNYTTCKAYSSSNVSNYDESVGDFTITRTEDVTYSDVEHIYIEYLGIKCFPLGIDGSERIAERVIAVADSLGDANLLENKIVIAVAIRYIAENYMISKINNPHWVNKISNSQTSELLKKFKNKVTNGDIPKDSIDENAVKLLEKVNIITPENIHINSFMYEPIVDMGISELKSLYIQVKQRLVL